MHQANHHPDTAACLMAQHLDLIFTDLQAWLALLTPDAVIEFPYAASLAGPVRLEGREAIAAYVRSFGDTVGPFAISAIEIMGSADGSKAWASFHGEALSTSGRKYLQDYAAMLTVRNGQIAYYKEYWNPCRVSHAFGTALVLDEAALPPSEVLA